MSGFFDTTSQSQLQESTINPNIEACDLAKNRIKHEQCMHTSRENQLKLLDEDILRIKSELETEEDEEDRISLTNQLEHKKQERIDIENKTDDVITSEYATCFKEIKPIDAAIPECNRTGGKRSRKNKKSKKIQKKRRPNRSKKQSKKHIRKTLRH